MKECAKCHQQLQTTFFNKSAKKKDGLQLWCRSCQKTQYQAYRLSAKEKAKARWKRYYDKNKERMIARTRAYEKSLGQDEYRKRWAERNKNARFKRYGITESEYYQVLRAQSQKCGMCYKLLDKTKPRSIHIDHSHATGKVRGILCDGCNLFLGRYENEAYQQRVEQAQTYLRKIENAKDKEPLVAE
jgi:hypothetical protein